MLKAQDFTSKKEFSFIKNLTNENNLKPNILLFNSGSRSPRILLGKGRIVKLDLSLLGIRSIPENIKHLSCVKALDIQKNKIRTLPDSICCLHNLRECNLHDNHLKGLPLDFGSLKNLEKLDLSKNKLTHLPESFASLANLNELSVRFNEFPYFPPEIGGLNKLREIEISQNKIPQEEFERFSYLGGNGYFINHYLPGLFSQDQILKDKQNFIKFLQKLYKWNPSDVIQALKAGKMPGDISLHHPYLGKYIDYFHSQTKKLGLKNTATKEFLLYLDHKFSRQVEKNGLKILL